MFDRLQQAGNWLLSGRDAAFNDKHFDALLDLLAAQTAAQIAVCERLDQIIEQLSGIAVTDYPPDAAEIARAILDARLDG